MPVSTFMLQSNLLTGFADHEVRIESGQDGRAVAVLAALTLACLCWSGEVLGQSIKTDASWGRTAQTLTGPSYAIPQTLGKLAGSNLFHSFETFNIRSGESAVFSTTTTLQNVISRVSGGGASSINGLLQLKPAAGSAPGFFFINPAGVTFGAVGSVDVPGAFHVSTANHLKLSDGTIFRAGNGPDSTFSVAPPEAFGFLGTTRAAITIREGTTLVTQPTQPISLAGGDIMIDNAGAVSDGGDIRVAAMGLNGREVPLSGSLPQGAGNLTFLDGGWIDVSTSASNRSGSIRVQAGDLLVDGLGNPTGTGFYGSAIGGKGNGAQIEINATGSFALLNGGVIAATTRTAGNAGAISIASPRVTIDDSIITVASSNLGVAGTVNITGGQIALTRGGQIWASAQDRGAAGSVNLTAADSIEISGRNAGLARSAVVVQTLGKAPAGRVDLSAPQILIRDDGLISGYAVGDTIASTAGHVHIRATDLVLESGGKVSVEGYDSMGQGSVAVEASGSIRIRGKGEEPNPSPGSDTVSTGILGHGTDIRISAPEISVTESGAIRSESWLQDVPGRIDITTQRLTLESGGHISGNALGHSGTRGIGAPIVIHAGEFVRVEGSRNGRDSTIASASRSSGGSGSISITTPWLRVADHGVINTGTGRFGTAGAGRIDIDVDRLELLSSGRLASIEWGHAAVGGRIAVSARDSILLDGGQILASGANEATAGKIVLKAPSVRLRGGLITTSNEEDALSGGIEINAGQIVLSDSSWIQSSSTSTAGAGTVEVNFADRLSLDHSSITTSANAGNGGSIRIRGGKLMLLENSQITTSVLGTRGNGGDIGVSASVLVMNTGFIQANTAARAASGGNVLIDVASLIPGGNTLTLGSRSAHTFTPGVFGYNVIEAAAPDGVSGNIQVSSPALDLAGALRGLSTATIDFGALDRDPCRVGAGSSLTPVGRGGLPATAGGAIRPEPMPSGATPAMSDVPALLAQASLLAPASTGKGCK